MANLLNMFAPKSKKERAQPIGGDMGFYDEEFEQGLEDKPQQGPQILGSITFNIPDLAPEVTAVVDAFYGLKKDIFGPAPTPATEEPQADNEAMFVRNRIRALQEEMQRLTTDKQENLMRDALRMGVNIIDVQIEVQKHTHPIQIHREQSRMAELGISDIVTTADEVAERQEQVEEAEEQQAAAEVKGPEIVVDLNAAPEGSTGQGQVHTGAISGAG